MLGSKLYFEDQIFYVAAGRWKELPLNKADEKIC
jgi:hypothetical protein